MTTWPDPRDKEIIEPLDHAYEHAALIIDSDGAVRARLVPVLNDLVARGAGVLMIVSAKVELLVRTEFGALSDQLEWREPSSFYQRLGFAYEEFRRYTAEQYAQGRRVHIVAEPDITTDIDPSSPVDRAAEYLSYEVVYNDIIAPYDCPLTCIWDARRHSTLIIENVRLLHSHEIIDGGKLMSVQHVAALDYLARRNEIPLPPPPADTDLDLTLSGLDGVGPVRTAVRAWALRQSFSDAAAIDIVIAVAEVVTNGIVHGAVPVRVRAWRHAKTLVVQVDDAGGRPLPSIAGYLAPDRHPDTGRGMWLARQLSDVVKVHTAGGITSVRLHFPYDVTHHIPVY
jgi:anti-sigma regulatory factor (Ser/Thr protein kinase)